MVEDDLDDVLRYEVLRLSLYAFLVALQLSTDVLRLYLQLLVHRLYVVGDLLALRESFEDRRVHRLEPYVKISDVGHINSLDEKGFGLKANLLKHEGDLLCGCFQCCEQLFQ